MSWTPTRPVVVTDERVLQWRRRRHGSTGPPAPHLWIANAGTDPEAITAMIQQCANGAASCTIEEVGLHHGVGTVFYITIQQADSAGNESAAAEQREDPAAALAAQIIEELNDIHQPVLEGLAPQLAFAELFEPAWTRWVPRNMRMETLRAVEEAVEFVQSIARLWLGNGLADKLIPTVDEINN